MIYTDIDLNKVDINGKEPVKEPERQYYFMAMCREWVRERKKKPVDH